MSDYVRDVARLEGTLFEALKREWCCHCRYWDPDQPPLLHEVFPDDLLNYDGMCRRYPPTVEDEDTDTWPLTMYRDWCGEYHKKPVPHLAEYIKAISNAQPADQ